MRRVKEGLAQEVNILNDRLIYLNNLRVGVGTFYVLVIGVLFASPTIFQTADLLTVMRFAGLPAIIMGISVFIFDLMIRARALAVARGIRERLEKKKKSDSLRTNRLLNFLEEDLFFALIIQVMNASALTVFLASFFFSKTSEIKSKLNVLLIAFGLVIFFAVLFAQVLVWTRLKIYLAKKMNEWPV